MRRFAFPWLALGVLALAGCQDAEIPALDRRLDEIRAKPAGRVEPLPQAPRYQAVTYDQAGLRSPFVPERPEPEENAIEGLDLAPNLDRPRDPLEQYPLDGLRLVGTLRTDGRNSALVRDPQGKVHRVYVGEHMGTDFGRIVSITDSSVQLVEVVSNGQGGWVERTRNISLKQATEQGQG
ncbi:type IV pilus assembly protein PilP [Modicisalibacter muralis]|uniref:Type IV pilus assembly protein PilP n=1 Tax=Modicisalibacter muralis TaxID=119000 RepID=A0A1G9JSB9_9GAMM|nr:pilus assembly protein PilP [Halomonas muralis]SDL40510.1 type IV pilus assembly protein PilP [Halomonas muralis]